MKKTILLGLLFLGTLFVKAPEVSAKTLYDCYKSKGLTWTSVKNRAVTAAENGVFYYRGKASQNTQLSNIICPKEELLGFSVATGYEKALSATVDATQDYIPVTALTLRDNTVLSIDALGGLVFLNIEPGANKEEIIMCTGINTSTVRFTGCTRGLAFSGTSTVSVSANRKTHFSGSKIVISNVHYVYEQFVDVNNKSQTIQGNRTVTGTWTFLGESTTTAGIILYAGDRRITAYNNGTNPFVRYNTSTGRWQFSDNGTDTTNLATSSAAGLSASSSQAIGIVNSEIVFLPSSTLGGAFGVDGRYYQKTSSTLAVENDSNGIKINTTTLDRLIATSTPGATNIIVKSNASGVLPVNWIATSTTNTHQFARSTSTGAYWGDLGTAINNTSTLGGIGSRAANVTYQNTSTFPMIVKTIWYAENTNKIEGFVSSTPTSGLKQAQFQSYATQQADVTLDLFVPAGWFYKFTVTGSGNFVVHSWVEIQL